MINDPGGRPVELDRAAEKAKRQQDRVAKREGFWATEAGQAIARKWLPELTAGLKGALRASKVRPVNREFLARIRELKSKERLALCILYGALNSLGKNETYADTAKAIGTNISVECVADGLTKGYGRTKAKRIAKFVAASASLKDRPQKFNAEAAKKGYKTNDWNEEHLQQAGNWAINQLLLLLPGVFARDDDSGQEKHLTLTPEAAAYADSFVNDVIRRNPVWLPETQPPRPWTGWNEGGTWEPVLQQSLHIIRSWHAQTDAAVRAAIREGTMQPALNALNALQAVPWTINKRVLKVIRECIKRRIVFEGLPGDEVPRSQLPEGMDAERERVWKETQREVRRENRRRRNDRVQLAVDLQTAELMTDHARFYTAMNFDWRGRVNTLPHFQFQRDDRIRALFLFADGEPIGEDGIYWLKVHLANCGDDNRVSKQAFDERVAWVDRNFTQIVAVVSDPLSELWWTKAEKPFMFLAACFELVLAVEEGATYVTHLPVSFDGSCSGLQHLCAMTRAPEGRLVNLAPEDGPQDIYQTVADLTHELIETDSNEEDADYRRMWLAYDREHGITRSTVKQNVMTYGYSGTVIGMAQQLLNDIINPEDRKALVSGTSRPFGSRWEDRSNASRYLAKKVYQAIELTVEGPAKVKAFLIGLSNAASDAGRALSWTTPVGISWINRYYQPRFKQIKLWLHDRSVPYATKRVVGEQRKIVKKKAAQGVAPNFVHACDAAHLLRTVNAAISEGITSIATVHDSFGCLPSRAERFRKIIREEFVRMYEEHDVLHEVLDQARRDLGDQAVSLLAAKAPPKGTLNIRDVNMAQYAFA